MQSRRFFFQPLLLLAPIIVLLLVACAGVPTQTMRLETGEQILHKVCKHCHSHERICENLGQDAEFWASRIKRMNLYGANLNQAQSDMMTAFLAMQQPDSKPVCHD